VRSTVARVLARVDGVTRSAVGSLDGGEISYKVNREVVLMAAQRLIYVRLLEVFLHDWALVIHQRRLPNPLQFPHLGIFNRHPAHSLAGKST
jgi:hypothetical protein